jgi:hypothetical protein
VFDVELLAPAIYVMAALTVFTVFQRVLHVRQQLADVPGGREPLPGGSGADGTDV